MPDTIQEEHPHDIMQVANPTDEDITVKWDRVPHTLNAGETAPYDRYLAEHICKHLTDREIRKAGEEEEILDMNVRNRWKESIIVGVIKSYGNPRKLTEGEKAAERQSLIQKEQEERLQALEEKLKETNERREKEANNPAPRKRGRPRKEETTAG